MSFRVFSLLLGKKILKNESPGDTPKRRLHTKFHKNHTIGFPWNLNCKQTGTATARQPDIL